MANIFDTSGSVQAVASNQTPIQQGVQDNTPAVAVQAIGGLFNQAAGQMVSQSVANDVKNILDTPEVEEVPAEIKPYLDRMGKLADGVKAGMQRNKAQLKARAVMAEAINQYPFFAKEIRERGATLFGIGSSSSQMGKVNAEVSPEEKAMNDYREKVTQTQLELGVSQQTAMNMIQSQKQNEIRKMNAENFTDDVFIGVNNATIQMQDQIFKTVFSTASGTLDAPQQRTLEIGVDRSAVLLQQQLMAAASNRGAVTQQIFETIDNQVKQYKQNMKTLISDQTTMKWMKQNNDLAAEMITAWGNQNYGGLVFLASNNTIPDSMKEAIFRSMSGDSTAKAIIENNPFLNDLMASSNQLNLKLRRAYGGVLNDMTGNRTSTTDQKSINQVSDADKALATTLMLNNKQGGAVMNLELLKKGSADAQDTIDKALRAAPENISRWTTPQYRGVFSNDKQFAVSTIEHELDVVSRVLRSRMIAGMEDSGEFDRIAVSEPRRALKEAGVGAGVYSAAGQAPEFQITGVDDAYTKSRMVDLYNVLKAYPEVWEGKAESISEYIDNLIKRPIDWKKPLSFRQNKSKALRDTPDNGVNRTSQVG